MSSSPAGGKEGVPAPVPLPRHWGVGEILAAKENRSVVRTLVMFSIGMVALPITTFFAFRDFVLADAAPNTRTFFSGMAAVLAANIIIAAYAIVAIKEDGAEGGASQSKATPLKVD